jgi:hypothetical protein
VHHLQSQFTPARNVIFVFYCLNLNRVILIYLFKSGSDILRVEVLKNQKSNHHALLYVASCSETAGKERKKGLNLARYNCLRNHPNDHNEGQFLSVFHVARNESDAEVK